MGNGLLYAAIVVVWAVVLVPMWLRRHDEGVETRSVDRFSSAMRVLARREARPVREQRYVVVPPRQPAEPAVTGSIMPTRPVLRPRDVSRARLMARRRRVVLGLLLVTALTLVLGGVGLIGMVPFPVLSSTALVGYLVHLRVQARRLGEQERRRLAADGRLRAQARREDAARPAYVRADRADRADQQRATTTPAAVPEPLPVDLGDQQTVRLVAAAEQWSPTPVPLPTYVTKPKAPGSAARSIDLGPGLWATTPASPPGAAELPEQAAPDVIDEPVVTAPHAEAEQRLETADLEQHPRAVND